jgi:protein-L-isoaspartate O-methyltransferase
VYLKGLLTALKASNKSVMHQMKGDVKGFLRIHFHYAAIEAGLVEALREPATKQSIVQKLSAVRPELLDALLELGIALGELAYSDGKYRCQGPFFRCLATEDADALAAFTEALVTYYNSVYRDLPDRLLGEPLGNYLPEIGRLVARASRLAEPFVKTFIESVVPLRRPVRILDVGCGEAGYLRHCAQFNPLATGVGLEMDKRVAALAQENLVQAKIDDRFRAVAGDLQQTPAEVGQGFDLVFLFNAVYYFSPQQRTSLFTRLREFLLPGGQLLLVSQFAGGHDLFAANLGAATCSMTGCWSLPKLEETESQLVAAGLEPIRVVHLLPRSSYLGVIAQKTLESRSCKSVDGSSGCQR